MSVGKKIQAYRRTHGLSVAELAARLGVARQTVGRWERGEWMPRAEHVIKLYKLGIL